MSLINKMLQDLDARGADGERSAASSMVRPVGNRSGGSLSPAGIGAGVLALAVLVGGGFAAWTYFRGAQRPLAATAAAPASSVIRKSGPVAAAAGDEGPPVVPGDITPEAHQAAGEKLARKLEERHAAAQRAAEEVVRLNDAQPRAERRQEVRRDTVSPAKPQPKAPAASVIAEGGEAALNSQQQAENEYRRALVKLQEARVSEALASLEQAVYLYPRHEAARQTLIGLLLEAGRTQEAIRHLTFATNLDPRQVHLAMLLARMQLENGGNALDTLKRSLPYAESNADYRALMAGILQRANRHGEAVEHYQAALRLQPANAVWWMGMGISLQAEQRGAEAKSAFQRAADSGRLSPELQTFVERRLQQLN
ncbi:tetratricopeptide repeat protein [Pseudoduganella violaceinigra]|uniref:tetratricopeptide repeat protein n=1 Tax=Pseudoduganella violaceinigra TaxID=246602 RepID=UPI0003FF0FCE|nr:tetratricopeptide repeat protein [Pseudoduganella violaceinigra]